MGALIVPACRKVNISGNLPPNSVIAYVESTGVGGVEESAPQSILPMIKEVDEKGDEESASICDGGDSNCFAEQDGGSGADSEGHVVGTVNRQQAMNALGMEEWRKVRRKEKCRVARPNDKLVVGARVNCKRKMKDGEVEKYGYRHIA